MAHINKEDFYSWFVGFSEGDGSLFSTKQGKAVRFEIWQTRADTRVLEFIRSELGFGKIIIPPHRPDMAIFIVEDIDKLIPIFATRLCMNRVNSRFNYRFKMENVRSRLTLGTAYLSGLIDAEGSFLVKQEAKTNTFKFIFEISQKDKQLLLEIQSLFSFKPDNQIYTDGCSWKLCFYSTKVREELIAYLTKYQLRSHKKDIFNDWIKGIRIKGSDAPDKTKNLLEIKQKINMWWRENS